MIQSTSGDSCWNTADIEQNYFREAITPDMTNKATIKDVAKLAGVSISTVSRVLNNSAHVEDDLKKRVLEATEATGYTPNEIARSLKRSHSALIAYVVSNTADPFFTFISRGIEEVMYLNGYSLINCSTNFSIERERAFLTTLNERRVEGIIINTVGRNDAAIAKISKSIPVVLSNRMIASPDFWGDFVDFDNVGGVVKLVRHLSGLGHKKIGFINGPLYISTAKERQDGFCQGMREIGVNVNDGYPHIYNSEETFQLQDGYAAARELLSREAPPTAIIASNTEMALGAMQYCRTNGIVIPDDVSLCSFGDIIHNDLMYVNITHTYTDLLAIGSRIGEVLLERIRRTKEGISIPNREIRFDTPLVVKGSTTSPKK